MKKVLVVMLLIFLITSCSKKSEKVTLEGNWILKSSEIENFSLPNDCNEIKIGDLFIFTDNKLQVVKKNEKCVNTRFVKRDNKLEFFYSDYSFNMKIKTIDNKNLVLISKILPDRMMTDFKEEYLKYKTDGFLITLKRDK